MSESPNDRKIAAEWMRVIEDPSSQQIREKDIYPNLKAWLDTVAPSQILEIGSGQGNCASVLNLQNKNYTGSEPSPTLLQRARELYNETNKSFVSGKAENLPFASLYFDAAFSIAVWHLLKDLNAAARELARVLKPHGAFLIICANPEAYSLWTAPYRNTQQQGEIFKGDLKLCDGSFASETLYLHGRQEILTSLETAGLKVTKNHCFRQVDGQFRFLQIEGCKTH
jgi:ubiquinone/menaquinone biosynthesis C-methylase UbiE